jgi:hypothetical protein
VKCYAFLADVPGGSVGTPAEDQMAREISFHNSRWFTRGWTLQELLAPQVVEFFSKDGTYLGDKISLKQQLHDITGIPCEALQDGNLSRYSVGERLRWAANRTTKKIEDKAYCLMGIFDVSMGLRFGEGEIAFLRFEKKVMASSKDE